MKNNNLKQQVPQINNANQSKQQQFRYKLQQYSNKQHQQRYKQQQYRYKYHSPEKPTPFQSISKHNNNTFKTIEPISNQLNRIRIAIQKRFAKSKNRNFIYKSYIQNDEFQSSDSQQNEQYNFLKLNNFISIYQYHEEKNLYYNQNSLIRKKKKFRLNLKQKQLLHRQNISTHSKQQDENRQGKQVHLFLNIKKERKVESQNSENHLIQNQNQFDIDPSRWRIQQINIKLKLEEKDQLIYNQNKQKFYTNRIISNKKQTIKNQTKSLQKDNFKQRTINSKFRISTVAAKQQNKINSISNKDFLRLQNQKSIQKQLKNNNIQQSKSFRQYCNYKEQSQKLISNLSLNSRLEQNKQLKQLTSKEKQQNISQQKKQSRFRFLKSQNSNQQNR